MDGVKDTICLAGRDYPSVSIGGKDYPMVFSLAATQAVVGRCGSLEKMNTLFPGNDEANLMENLFWMLALLVNQGVARRNLLEGDNDTAPTQEEISILMDGIDINGLMKKVFATMNRSMTRTVETEPEDGEKNGAATQGEEPLRGASTSD